MLATLKAKEVAGTGQAPAPSRPVEAPVTESPTSPIPPEHTKYYAICTPLGKICLNEYPMSLDWDEDLEEGERKNQERK